MVIGTCTIELYIPGNGSLKGKRRVIKSIIARVHNEFNSGWLRRRVYDRLKNGGEER